MLIRKSFKFEMAHIVRRAWSKRCSANVHGHSYVVECFLQGGSRILDNAQMVIDFGVVKELFNDLVDSFDHSLCLWDVKENKKLIKFAKANFERVIVLPFNPSAEMQATFFCNMFNLLLRLNRKGEVAPPIDTNGAHPDVFVKSVRLHETVTGYAEADMGDYNSELCGNYFFSAGIRKDWKQSDLLRAALAALVKSDHEI